ncbi:pumilio 5 [Tripterygium wilfordii]|uniref:Pumilio 5 n=1 Tax=Tripterygium wilfordii TaxID=458696 RepID=A0A7J7CYQ8_TRIWF|nr:pumilio homolog 5-like [Tripterygium wilfordii]KAF5739213.1 pumilio 5 [Tripterygium wilfordii]
MATESPMRLVESGRSGNWSSSNDTPIFRVPLKDLAAEELGLLLKGHRFRADQMGMLPNRSGSAPPSMEGAYAAIENLLAQQNTDMNSGLANISSSIQNYDSEEQLRSDPAYVAYYSSNVNLNPRLPQPLIPLENRFLVHRVGGLGSNWSCSVDDSGDRSLKPSRVVLSTHKEEPEDDQSPRQTLGRCSENNHALMHGQNTSLAGLHKSLVDLIQEDFPRTPSPVYSLSRPSSHATEEVIDHDLHAISLNISSINISKVPESNSGSTCITGSPMPQEDDQNTTDGDLEGIASTRGGAQSDLVTRNKQEEPQSHGKNMSPYHQSQQEGNPYLAQGVPAEVISQELNYSESGEEQNPNSHSTFFPTEVQPSLHSSGLATPLYESPYMTSGSPVYPNFHQSAFYASQYTVGGYALNSAYLPPLMAGYTSHGAIPIPFDANSGQNFDGQIAGVSSGESFPHAGDLQHLDKFYGQQGFMLQPSFVDPLHMHYFQHPFGDAHGASVQQVRLASGGVTGGQIDPFFLQKESAFPAYINDQKFRPRTNGSPSIYNSGKMGTSIGSYYGGPPSMGLMTQFPASPLSSPVLPSSPVGGINHLGRRNEIRFPQVSTRTSGPYSEYHVQRGLNTFQAPKRHSFLEELKSSNAGKFELSDIAGRIVEFSVDQHGSRFIQQKLEHCSVEDKISVFKELVPHASKLITDVFGNYVIQKFFEHGSPGQREELANHLAGQMLPFCLQMYGCRVIQKALEVIQLDQKMKLVRELDGHVMRCVRDQNGNHVIQKCIECVPSENIGFIISAFRGQVATLSSHPYGCRVIQRVLEHCSDKQQTRCIVDEILESASLLAQDQYGNYVTQHVLERGKPHERRLIVSKLTGKVVQMSQHKYASNVVEKCLEYGDAAERELLIEEIIGQSEENDNLLVMMKDQFANYVVQRILEISNDKQREILLDRIRVHLNALKKYTYGKHIVARFEQLCGEESEVVADS